MKYSAVVFDLDGTLINSEPNYYLADKDFIWVFDKTKDDFHSCANLKMHWNELSDANNLNKLKEKLKN